MTLSKALNYASEHQHKNIKELIQLCSIPSVSATPKHKQDVIKTAQWLVDKLKAIGLSQVTLMQTPGFPIVYAEYLGAGKQAKTVLVYGHYDVQPAEEETLSYWDTMPFEPTIIGDNLYARGATDMKGQIMAAFNAVEAILATGSLSVNLKFLIEGEEEIGSSHLEEFIQTHKDLLACDIFLNPDAGMIGADLPTITYGLRGLAIFELFVYGAKNDLHSGSFGGVVHNPAQALCKLIAAMHDEKNRVTLPGFYDKVHTIDDNERKEIARLPLGEDFFLQQTGVTQLWGEEGYTPEERIGIRPTLEINGIYSGFIAEGFKTVLPGYAMAKISTRLVLHQNPAEVHQQMLAFLKENVPPTVTWKLNYMGGSPASISQRSSAAIRAISKAFEKVWGKQPLSKREGGSVPVVLHAQNILKADVVNIGFSLPEDMMHGPNEKLHLPTWTNGIKSLIYFFNIVGEETSA